MRLFDTELITESLKAEKIEDVANDVDAADKKKAAGKKEAAKKEEAPKEPPKGDPPKIEGKIEDMVGWNHSCLNKFGHQPLRLFRLIFLSAPSKLFVCVARTTNYSVRLQ